MHEEQLKDVRRGAIPGKSLAIEEEKANSANRPGSSLTLHPHGRPRKGPERPS